MAGSVLCCTAEGEAASSSRGGPRAEGLALWLLVEVGTGKRDFLDGPISDTARRKRPAEYKNQ